MTWCPPGAEVCSYGAGGIFGRAIGQGISPTPNEIRARLGATSASYARHHATLAALYAEHGASETVRLKRQLWSRVLRSVLGTQFTDDDELFLKHTLLVNSAEIIAHLVVGLDVTDMQPAALLGGQRLGSAAIYGVVEHDFFDWVLEVPSGDTFVRTLARQLSDFDWANVEHDVLKVLYESVIGSDSRKQLGEYYTPDWLAEQVVSTTVTDPLNQRVLDPACGSGTFLFHAVRRYLDAARETGTSLEHSLSGLTGHVLGVDLHPVAVALARVTYLIAIGRGRLLHPDRGAITVPVYLGDSVQWNQRLDLLTEGRDHLWSCYIPNLAAPAWLARPENRADVLVGNPPWLSYRYMPDDMQAAFRQMSESYQLWHGSEVATHQDLSGLFVVRTVQRYLAEGGSFAFVIPNAVLDRDYYAGFRRGDYPDPADPITVRFTGSWDLRRLRPHFFPRGAAVVFGQRSSTRFGTPLPSKTTRWTGRLPRDSDTWEVVSGHLAQHEADLAIRDQEIVGSPYRKRFTQGATIVPRVLFMVEKQQSGPLGLAAGRQTVRSARSSAEKMPWKALAALEGIVENKFVRPTLLGESILPFRVLAPKYAVLPLESAELLDGEHARLDQYPGLADWWRKAEQLWLNQRSSARLTLLDQLDFRSKLTNQLPAPPLRVVYSKAGMHVAAALVDSPNAIIDHKLYWGAATNRAEAFYLCCILNSPTITELVRPLMSYCKDERDIDKHVWKLPIPVFNDRNPIHRRLSKLGEQCTDLIAGLDLSGSRNFVTLRRRARAALAADPTAAEINEIVLELLAVGLSGGAG